MNVARHLTARAEAQADQMAVLELPGGRDITFGALAARSDSWAAGLRAHGIGRGERTLVLVRAGVDLITLTYALFKAGAVPVLIDPGMGRASFLRCVQQVAPTSFIGIPLAHAFAKASPGAFSSVRDRKSVV